MPLYPDSTNKITQVKFTSLNTDSTTTSTTFVNLITQSITIQEGSYLLIRSSFSTSDSTSSGNINAFRITVDGVSYAEGGAEIWTPSSQSGAIVCKVGPMTGGAHIINLDWHTASGNTLRCRPLTQPEQASIVTTEITDQED
jgi:hypothetical protein